MHNALFQLADIYGIDIPNITGGKTGMTGDAGFCLLSYSNTTPEQLYCIVLGSEIKPGTLYHLTDTEKLYTFVKDKDNVIWWCWLQGEENTYIFR